MKTTLKKAALRSATCLSACAVLVSGSAYAQDITSDANATAADAPTDAIVVTGSRIRQPNLESASPITVVSSQEIKATGTTRVEDLINSLPQVFAGQGGNVSNGASGIATLDLRGLGSERTLVLVNGRRLGPGDPTTSAADINAIPGALINRVDVLTGGASSVYGSDAVSGVVNFILDTEFEGFRIDSQYSLYNHNNRAGRNVTDALDASGASYPKGNVTDGGTIDATAVFGAGFDDGRGHVTAYVGYRKINAVTQGRRDYSACALSARTTAQAATAGNDYTCSGSATSPRGSFIIYDTTDPTDPDSFTSTFFQVGAGRTLVPGSTPYNFNPTNYYQRPDERYTAGLFASYEISDSLKPYAEFMFMDDRSVAQIAYSGNFGNTFSLNCDNPLLSAQQLSIVCDTENLLSNPGGDVVGPNGTVADAYTFYDPLTGAAYNRGFAQILRRNTEGAPRRDDLQHTQYRIVAGMKGDLGSAWSYDAFYQYNRTVFAETYYNDLSVTRITRALDVVTDPATGAPTCRSVLDGTDTNCVPWDIFTPGGVTAAAGNYLATPGFQRGINGEQVVSASLSGALGEYGVQTPWAEEGVGIAIGAEYRKESLEFNSDLAFQTGDLAGQGAPTLPVSGSFNVKEVFGELRVPIVSKSFIYDLTLTGGYRHSQYKSQEKFSTDAYKIEAEFAPIADIRFRGGYNRAVRAPTVQDLFAPNRVALDGSSDPCAGFVITAADVGCLAQGLSVGQTVSENPAQQYNGLIGGNANLSPEVADTYTVGVVLQPRWIPRFALSVDYYNIKLDGAITGIGADVIVNQCTSTADPYFCNLVNRDQFGSLWRSSDGYITNTTQNIGGLSTKGIDVNASYSYDAGRIGSFGFSFVGTYLKSLVTDTGVSGSYNCAGYYGNSCGVPAPKWRHQARVSWTSDNGLGASLRWRHFDSVDVDVTSDNPNLAGTTRPGIDKLEAVDYFDLSFTARIAEHYNFRLGANNLLDKDPPLTGSQACPAGFCNGNTFAQVYDAVGRYVYVGVTLDF